MQNCSPLTLLHNKLSEQYIIVTMCMLPAQYHVWLAIFTPLIADKFLVRPKEYTKIAGSLNVFFTATLDEEEKEADKIGRTKLCFRSPPKNLCFFLRFS